MGTVLETFINTFKLMQSPQMYQTVIPSVFFNIIAVVCAVVILALFVIGGIVRKKNMVVAIIAGIFNFLSALFLPWFVRLFHQLPIGIYTFGSSEDAAAFMLSLLVKTFLFMGLSALILIGFVLSIVYIASCFKSKPAIFAVGALILVIVRYLFIPPYQTILTIIFKLAITDIATQTTVLAIAQSFQYILYYAVLMLALLLCVLSALTNKSKEAKIAKAEAAKAEAKEQETKAEIKAEIKAEMKAEAEAEAKAEAEAEKNPEEKVEEKTEKEPAEEKITAEPAKE